jgi:hypothetical protein
MRRLMWRLALIMGCTLRELLQRLDSNDVTELLLIRSIDGWPGDTWPNAGVIAATIANCHSKKSTFSPEDFMPHGDAGPDEELSWDEVRALWQRPSAN